jgi:hypothetical protein
MIPLPLDTPAPRRSPRLVVWIKLTDPSADPALAEALADVRPRHPREYAHSPESDARLPPLVREDSIVLTHGLFPDVLKSFFSAYAALLGPDKPLSRRQHEMIAATVSALNRCFY